LITTALTADYDPYNVWSLIQDDVTAHLPLRNLHWKSASRPLRSIQSLDVEMQQYDPAAGEQPHQMPISLLERPYLNMMLVQCEVYFTYAIDRNLIARTTRRIATLSAKQSGRGTTASSQSETRNGSFFMLSQNLQMSPEKQAHASP
jgi:hypothetical protein